METSAPGWVTGVSTVVARLVLDAAQGSGVPRDELLREAGVQPELLADPDGLLPRSAQQRIWETAVHRLGPQFGLDAARTLGRGSFRALEYACRASPTFGDALHQLVRFGCLLHGGPLFTMDPLADGCRIRYLPQHPVESVGWATSDFALASIVIVGRDAVGTPWDPTRVEVAHPLQGDRTPYEEVFQAPLHFDASEYALYIADDVLRLRMPEADAALQAILERYLHDRVSGQAEAGATIVERTAQELVHRLPDQSASLDAVAMALGMSSRTLQKRLKASGTRFKDLAEQARLDMARHYLEREDTSLAGIALLLGYSELSAFVRAFSRWTGETPGEYRRRIRNETHQQGS